MDPNTWCLENEVAKYAHIVAVLRQALEKCIEQRNTCISQMPFFTGATDSIKAGFDQELDDILKQVIE